MHPCPQPLCWATENLECEPSRGSLRPRQVSVGISRLKSCLPGGDELEEVASWARADVEADVEAWKSDRLLADHESEASWSCGLAPGVNRGHAPGVDSGYAPGVDPLDRGLLPGVYRGLWPGVDNN